MELLRRQDIMMHGILNINYQYILWYRGSRCCFETRQVTGYSCISNCDIHWLSSFLLPDNAFICHAVINPLFAS